VRRNVRIITAQYIKNKFFDNSTWLRYKKTMLQKCILRGVEILRFEPRESSRKPTIVSRFIFLILTDLRSSVCGALTLLKTQNFNAPQYSSRIGFWAGSKRRKSIKKKRAVLTNTSLFFLIDFRQLSIPPKSRFLS
jgi:hypothetical protein